MTQVLLDTNVILRLLLGDVPALATAAQKLFDRAARGELTLVLRTVVVVEAAHVLRSVYKLNASDIAASLGAVVAGAGIDADQPSLMSDALSRYAQGKLHLVDCLLLVDAVAESMPLATFDKALAKATGKLAFDFA